jgi:transcriptional regulator with AAA-type ATPase domain
LEKYRAILFVHGGTALGQSDLSADDILQLRGQTTYTPTRVFLLKVGELELLASACSGAIYDRGRKSIAKPLAYYLGRRTGLVRIRADYQNPGQAERGIHALMKSTGIRPKGSVFLIGLSDTLFDQLWNRAPRNEDPDAAENCRDGVPETDQLGLLLDQNARLMVPKELKEKYVGDSAAADGVRKRIMLAAAVPYAVLIEGETGTGKEVVARQIHQFSSRHTENFVAVNCGGIPSELFESELFGHLKGSFTGALRDKAGHWTQASHGTLFLDEIGDLSSSHQVKVLRALEDGRYRPVGGTEEIKSDARIIAATNRDLRQMVAAGKFREDLFYRLFTLRIRTPSLREQPSVIPELATHFWHKLANYDGLPLLKEVLEELKNYAWPGNARELRSFLTSVFVIADGEPVTLTLVRAVMRDRLGAAFSFEKDR